MRFKVIFICFIILWGCIPAKIDAAGVIKDDAAKKETIKIETQSKTDVNHSISFEYIKIMENLPFIDLAADDKHPVSPPGDIQWDRVAKHHSSKYKPQEALKKDLIQEYVILGKPFQYAVYLNVFKPCEKCHENIGQRPVVYIISAKKNLLMQTSGEKIHRIKVHGDSFSGEEIKLLKNILGI